MGRCDLTLWWVCNEQNPIALKAVSLADDGVDYVQSKLTIANATASVCDGDMM